MKECSDGSVNFEWGDEVIFETNYNTKRGKIVGRIKQLDGNYSYLIKYKDGFFSHKTIMRSAKYIYLIEESWQND